MTEKQSPVAAEEKTVVAKVDSPKKAAAAKAKQPKAKPSHPNTAVMVNAAIKTLSERGGSSLQAIKKYITANYKVDAEKLAPFIKRYLKSSVVSGVLTQVKGKGAAGSFKITAATKKTPSAAAVAKPKTKADGVKKSATATKKPAAAVKKVVKKTDVTKAVAKKTSAVKKISTKKPVSEKKVAAPAKPKASPKAKKATRAPAAAKPKVPKPKKTPASPKTAAKKAVAKK